MRVFKGCILRIGEVTIKGNILFTTAMITVIIMSKLIRSIILRVVIFGIRVTQL